MARVQMMRPYTDAELAALSKAIDRVIVKAGQPELVGQTALMLTLACAFEEPAKEPDTPAVVTRFVEALEDLLGVYLHLCRTGLSSEEPVQ